MIVIRSSQIPPDAAPGTAHEADPLQERATELFTRQLAANLVPSVSAIRAQLHVGQPRAQRLRDHLATGVARQAKSPAA